MIRNLYNVWGRYRYAGRLVVWNFALWGSKFYMTSLLFVGVGVTGDRYLKRAEL